MAVLKQIQPSAAQAVAGAEMDKYLKRMSANQLRQMVKNQMLQQAAGVGVQKKEPTKYGALIDKAVPTHSSPTKNGNGVNLHLKGQLTNYVVYVPLDKLPSVPFGKPCNVREYHKEIGKPATSVVLMIAPGLRKWTGLPKAKPQQTPTQTAQSKVERLKAALATAEAALADVEAE